MLNNFSGKGAWQQEYIFRLVLLKAFRSTNFEPVKYSKLSTVLPESAMLRELPSQVQEANFRVHVTFGVSVWPAMSHYKAVVTDDGEIGVFIIFRFLDSIVKHNIRQPQFATRDSNAWTVVIIAGDQLKEVSYHDIEIQVSKFISFFVWSASAMLVTGMNIDTSTGFEFSIIGITLL